MGDAARLNAHTAMYAPDAVSTVVSEATSLDSVLPMAAAVKEPGLEEQERIWRGLWGCGSPQAAARLGRGNEPTALGRRQRAARASELARRLVGSLKGRPLPIARRLEHGSSPGPSRGPSCARPRPRAHSPRCPTRPVLCVLYCNRGGGVLAAVVRHSACRCRADLP